MEVGDAKGTGSLLLLHHHSLKHYLLRNHFQHKKMKIQK